MKIRIFGTEAECNLAQDYYKKLESRPEIRYVSVSRLYPNRGSDKLYRVYIDIEYNQLPQKLLP